MAKKQSAAKVQGGPYQRMLSREAARVEAEPLVPPVAAAKGDFRRETIAVTKGEFAPAEPIGNVPIIRNRGGTTIERWGAAGALEQHQIHAMELYSAAWHKIHSQPATTMKWEQRIAFSRGGEEARLATLVDAQELLGLLDDRVFSIAPRYYFDVWQNIVLFDQAAGVAGGAGRNSAERAKTICLFMADMIATILRL